MKILNNENWRLWFFKNFCIQFSQLGLNLQYSIFTTFKRYMYSRNRFKFKVLTLLLAPKLAFTNEMYSKQTHFAAGKLFFIQVGLVKEWIKTCEQLLLTKKVSWLSCTAKLSSYKLNGPPAQLPFAHSIRCIFEFSVVQKNCRPPQLNKKCNFNGELESGHCRYAIIFQRMKVLYSWAVVTGFQQRKLCKDQLRDNLCGTTIVNIETCWSGNMA